MTRPLTLNRRAFYSSILLTFAVILPFSAARATFDPDAGGTTTVAPAVLPDPAAIYGHSTAVITATPSYISPLAPVQMPNQPLYPARVDAAAPNATASPAIPSAPAVIAPPTAESPAAPPVQASSTPPPAEPTPPSTGFIAPAPLLAENPLAQPTMPAAPAPAPPTVAAVEQVPAPAPAALPVSTVAMSPSPPSPATPPATAPNPEQLTPIPVNPAPVAIAVPASAVPVVPTVTAAPAQVHVAAQEAAQVSAPPATELSPQTRAILSHIPGHLDQTHTPAGSPISLERVSPDVKDVLGDKAKEESYEAVGLSMKVRRPGLDENYELNRAYAALMGGDTDTAIETYKNILSTDPKNQDALFGLAATYHRLGNLEKARPLYGLLLQVNPNHREGLNNFLALVAEESPQDALPELERLEARNPEFSPIPAQIAVVLEKMGYADEAREKMLRAIELAPDNLTYKYNLAVMLDHQGQAADASALYRMLIDSSLHGQAVPAPVAVMQKRVNYLTLTLTKTPPVPTASINVSVPISPAAVN